MRKSRRKKMSILAAAVCAASLSAQAPVFASPAEELQEIMKKQFETEEEFLLGKTLGFSALEKAIKSGGFSLEAEGSLTDGTAQILNLEDSVPEGSSAKIGLQVDPAMKKWLFQLGLTRGIDSLIDLSLYGDQEQLALTLPQFFSGAVGIRSGSFLDQYEGSAVQSLLEGEDKAAIPDFNLIFYPEVSDQETIRNMKDRILEKSKGMEETLAVQAREEGGATIYTAVYPTQDILDLYRIVLEEYMAVFEQSGLMVSGDAQNTREEFDAMLDQIASITGDEISVDFSVRNGLVEKISYELYCDTVTEDPEVPETDPETDLELETITGVDVTEAQSETDSRSFVDIDVTVEEPEDFQGYLNYELAFAEPETPWKAFTFCMTAEDMERNETGAFCLEKTTEETADTSSTEIRIELSDNGKTLYSDVPVTYSFNAGTGAFDASLKLNDSDANLMLKLSSVFSEIEQGNAFLWTINELSMEADGEKAGVQGSLRLAANPGAFEAPSEERMVLDLNETELTSLLMEVMGNGQAWAAQFEPETETETEADTEIFH